MFDITQSPLNFSITANNDETVRLSLTRRSDRTAPDLTGAYVKWQLFKNGIAVVTKLSTDGGITLLDQTQFRGKLDLNIDAEDTVSIETETLYIHQFVIVDSLGNANNPATDDWKLSPGQVWVARQYAVQP